jgi:ABC-type oligopeptide transport system substrate-binding subunit
MGWNMTGTWAEAWVGSMGAAGIKARSRQAGHGLAQLELLEFQPAAQSMPSSADPHAPEQNTATQGILTVINISCNSS